MVFYLNEKYEMLPRLLEVEGEIGDATVQAFLHQRPTFIGRHLIRIPGAVLSRSVLHRGFEISLIF